MLKNDVRSQARLPLPLERKKHQKTSPQFSSHHIQLGSLLVQKTQLYIISRGTENVEFVTPFSRSPNLILRIAGSSWCDILFHKSLFVRTTAENTLSASACNIGRTRGFIALFAMSRIGFAPDTSW